MIARQGDAGQLRKHKSADGIVVFILGQVEAELLVQVVNVNAGIDFDEVVFHQLNAGFFFGVVLVSDFADNFFEDVFHGHESCNTAVFVEHNCHVDVFSLHVFEQGVDADRLGDVERFLDDVS